MRIRGKNILLFKKKFLIQKNKNKMKCMLNNKFTVIIPKREDDLIIKNKMK